MLRVGVGIKPMENASLTVSLPRAMKDFIEEQLREGTFSTPSEYIRSLIRTDRERASRRTLEAFVRGGLRCRDLPQLDDEDWRAIQAFVVERTAAKQKNGRSKRVSAGSL
jgi:antitoxin ParD1/3/4